MREEILVPISEEYHLYNKCEGNHFEIYLVDEYKGSWVVDTVVVFSGIITATDMLAPYVIKAKNTLHKNSVSIFTGMLLSIKNVCRRSRTFM